MKTSPADAVLSKAVINVKPKVKAASGAVVEDPVYAYITTEKLSRLDGRERNYLPQKKSYSGYVAVPNVASANGVPATADIDEIVDQIVAAAQGDEHAFVYCGETKVVDVTDRTAAIDLDISDGTTTSTVDADTMALVVAAINADANALAYAWSEDGTGVTGTIYIVPRGNWAITTAGHDNCADSTTYVDCIGMVSNNEEKLLDFISEEKYCNMIEKVAGSYARLTAADVQRLFPIQSWHFHQRPTLPLENTSYYKYTFVEKSDAYSLDGMNHMDKYKGVLEVYVASTGSNITNFENALTSAGMLISAAYTTAVFTLTGTAGADGVIVISVDGVEFSIDIPNTTTPAQAGDIIAAVITDHPDLTCTDDDAGELTIVKSAGLSEVVVVDGGLNTMTAGTVTYS